METIDFGKDAAAPSGAPEAGGATSRGSQFGGRNMLARFLRAVARVARDVEAEAYRRLRDLERDAGRDESVRPGAPNRVRHAHNHDDGDARIH
ncbi:MAG TPA: hypothetical protein VGL86_26675 [Polyangia bacterium]|jgi:hypothetical protein